MQGNLWEKTATPAPRTLLVENVRSSYDLVVIGGGYSGCAAAIAGAEMGASVGLFEAKTIGYGGSGRNVGLVNSGLLLTPDEVDATIGKRAGAKLYESLSTAPDSVFGLIDRHNIECEARRKGTLLCAHSGNGFQELRKHAAQLTSRGAPVELLDQNTAKHRIGSERFHGALFDPRAGTINPLSYCRGLARAAQKIGVELHEFAPLESLKRTSSGWQVMIAGKEVLARSVILATNAYQDRFKSKPKPQFTTVSYFQVATRPLEKTWQLSILPGKEGCWDTTRGMSSFRLDNDGRLIIGGFGSLDAPGRSTHIAWARRKLAQLFPQLAREPFEQAWCGKMSMTGDRIPKILEIGQGAVALFGYFGSGIGAGTVFGAAAAKFVLENDLSQLPLYPVEEHREKMTFGKAALYEARSVANHMLDARGLLV